MRIKIHGSHDLTSAEIALQQVMAELQDRHVAELDRINIYLTPKRANGDAMAFGPKKTDAFEIIPDKPVGQGSGKGGPRNRRQ